MCTLIKGTANAQEGNGNQFVTTSVSELSAKSAVLVQPESGTVLFAKNENEKRACGSVTKVMSLLLIMEAIDNNKISLEDTVTVSDFANGMGGSEIWLETGEQMTVDELLKAVCIQSANDATVALAEHVAGDEATFLKMMNDKASDLGMKNTHFLNTTGFDEEGQFTTAYDISLMASSLIKHDLIFDYCQLWQETLRNGETELANTNKMLKTYNGMTGLKTGTTDDAGNCFCGTACRDNMNLISVVLGCESSAQRFSDTKLLLDYGFSNFSIITPTIDKSELLNVQVLGGMKPDVDISCNVFGKLVCEKGKQDKIIHKINIASDLQAPVQEGQKVGTVDFLLDNKKLISYDIITKSSVEKISFSKIFGSLIFSLLKN